MGHTYAPDFSEIRGLSDVVSQLAAVVERHARGERVGILLSGPPGTGKTMLARRVSTILPPLADIARYWIAAEHSDMQWIAIAERSDMRRFDPAKVTPPFRAPHYTISGAALVGATPSPYPHEIRVRVTCRCERAINGDCQWHSLPKPVVPVAGELHRARFGVLFLDELTEFARLNVEVLGHALEAMAPSTRPLVVASVNPCPCGWRGETVRECTCTAASIARHVERERAIVSALRVPLVTINVPALALDTMRTGAPCESSTMIQARIVERLAAKVEV